MSGRIEKIPALEEPYSGQRRLQIRRQEFKRTVLLGLVVIVALDDEALVPVEPRLGGRLGQSDLEVWKHDLTRLRHGAPPTPR